MPKFKNVSPLGALDLPLIGRVVAAGETIDVTAAQAQRLAGQDETWKPIRPAPRPKKTTTKPKSTTTTAAPTTAEELSK